MKQIELKQGSKEWIAHRLNHFNASEAAAMLGVSSHESRTDFMKRLAYIEADPSRFQQVIYDRGHEYEALARPLAEKIIGEDFYPVVGVSTIYPKLAASFDGMTILGDIIFEHKTLNSTIEAIAFDTNSKVIVDLLNFPEMYLVQMEQQLLVSGAEKCLFMATKWDAKNLIDYRYFYYFSNNVRREKIITGWTTFEIDYIEFKKTYELPKLVEPKQLDILPMLRVEVKGEVVASNIADFEKKAFAVLNSIQKNLVTDQDFIDATETVKWCKDISDKITASKKAVLDQTAGISELLETLEKIAKKTDKIRIGLTNLIESEKESRKIELIKEYRAKIEIALNQFEIETRHSAPVLSDNFANCVKHKRTLDSMRDSLFARTQELLATIEIEKKTVLKNAEYFKTINPVYANLIDKTKIIRLPYDNFVLIVEANIARIQKQFDDQAKLEAENKAKIEAELKAKIEAEKLRKAENKKQLDEQKQLAIEKRLDSYTSDLIEPTNTIAPIEVKNVSKVESLPLFENLAAEEKTLRWHGNEFEVDLNDVNVFIEKHPLIEWKEDEYIFKKILIDFLNIYFNKNA